MAKMTKMGGGKPSAGAKSALAGLGRALAMRAAMAGAGAGGPPPGAGPDMSAGPMASPPPGAGAPGMKKGGKATKKACSGGSMKKYAKGGKVGSGLGVDKQMPTSKQMGNLGMAKGGLLAGKKSDDGIAKRGKTRALRENMDGGQGVTAKETKGPGQKYAKGGSVFSKKTADGIAQRGKTRAKMVAKGGKC